MTKTAILAGGCFWCVEHDMHNALGVLTVLSGYTGGDDTTPTYEEHIGHREAIEVHYDSEVTSYKSLLQYFIDHIDPTDAGGQFGDRGESYLTAIYYENDEEKTIAEGVIKELDDSHVYNSPSAVQILKRRPFYKAEEYHQNYADKNPLRYNLYRTGSGREGFINKTCQIREEKHISWSN
jgi:methionine-S-sulfoxide reductase